MGRCGHGHLSRCTFSGHVQHRADLQAGNGDRGTTGKDGPADRHLQASREPLAQVGQHGRRHWKGTPGDTL